MLDTVLLWIASLGAGIGVPVLAAAVWRIHQQWKDSQEKHIAAVERELEVYRRIESPAFLEHLQNKVKTMDQIIGDLNERNRTLEHGIHQLNEGFATHPNAQELTAAMSDQLHRIGEQRRALLTLSGEVGAVSSAMILRQHGPPVRYPMPHRFASDLDDAEHRLRELERCLQDRYLDSDTSKALRAVIDELARLSDIVMLDTELSQQYGSRARFLWDKAQMLKLSAKSPPSSAPASG